MNIVQVFPGKIWGGAEQYILDLGKALTARGHNVSYLSRNVEAVTGPLHRHGIDVRPLPFSHALDFKTIRELSHIMADADVIHLHDTSFVIPAVIARTRIKGRKPRILLTRHDAHGTIVGPWAIPFFMQLDAIIFVSDFARRGWLRINRWVPAAKCHIILNSIPPSTSFPVENLRDKYSIAPETPLIVYSGRIKKSKGCTAIIEALSQLAELPFAMVFIGSFKNDAYGNELKNLIERYGLSERMHFYGFTDHARLLAAQADIGLAPPIAKDACPLSAIEFLMNGVCEITSTNGGQTEFVTDGETGLIVPPGDVEALASAIRRLIENPCLRKKLAESGKTYFNQEMAYDRFVDKILSVYNS